MIDRFHDLIQQIATPHNLFLMLAIFIGMNLVLMFAPFSPFARLQEYSDGAGMLDLEFAYTPDRAYEIATAYGEEGREYYVSVFSLFDLFTPILMALFLGIVISIVFRQAFSPDNPVQKLNLLPFVALVGDYLENLGIVSLMLAYPTRMDMLARAASLGTMIKFIFTVASVVCIVIGLVVWLVNMYR